ncbi:hypothetical protein [Aliamphritea spongicola]|nr:hypothetical protein [Aliamphritea spongicola]
MKKPKTGATIYEGDIPNSPYLIFKNGYVIEDNTALLEGSKQQCLTSLASLILRHHNLVTGNANQHQITNWPEKSRRAERIVSGKSSTSDISIVSIETAKRNRGETIKELTEKQLQKANDYAIKMALIDGIQADAKQQINAVTDISELKPLMSKIETLLEQELHKLSVQQPQLPASVTNTLISQTSQKLRNLFRI